MIVCREIVVTVGILGFGLHRLAESLGGGIVIALLEQADALGILPARHPATTGSGDGNKEATLASVTVAFISVGEVFTIATPSPQGKVVGFIQNWICGAISAQTFNQPSAPTKAPGCVARLIAWRKRSAQTRRNRACRAKISGGRIMRPVIATQGQTKLLRRFQLDRC